MALKVGMPNLGHTMETGKLAEWLVGVGDAVQAGEVLATVETEKATFDIESPGDGVVLAVLVPAGLEVPVGSTLAFVGAAGEAVPDSMGEEASASDGPGHVTTDAAPAPKTPGRSKASPAARRRAEELGIDLATVEGTGDDGLISREDVEAAAAAVPSQVRPLSQMRQAIADATTRAWTTVPHVALSSHADLGDAIDPRRITAAVVRACALALHRHPSLNGWLTAEGFQQADAAHVGIVVAVPDGLVTATITAANRKSTGEIAQEIASLAGAARDGTLKGARTTGASVTVSSLGRWGVDTFAPVISAPQVAILGVGRVRRAPRETDNGIRFVNELGLTLVFDHRANDGVTAAECLAEIVRLLEDPHLLDEPA
jgi:pyruvate dehydrogenase E2 component (dihydrolipoamide acetyltransferase)